MRKPINGLLLGMMSGIGFAGAENVYYVFRTLEESLRAMKETGKAGYLVMPVYNNVVRMAMTPFLHACFSAIFGYFIALGVAQRRHRFVFFLLGCPSRPCSTASTTRSWANRRSSASRSSAAPSSSS
jgi:RsiW-degrading membrane proteinase PrsW (M82 family)